MLSSERHISAFPHSPHGAETGGSKSVEYAQKLESISCTNNICTGAISDHSIVLHLVCRTCYYQSLDDLRVDPSELRIIISTSGLLSGLCDLE